LTPGEEDESEEPKHVFVAVNGEMTKTQVEESSTGRRDCLPVPFSEKREHGMGRSTKQLFGFNFLH